MMGHKGTGHNPELCANFGELSRFFAVKSGFEVTLENLSREKCTDKIE